MARRAGWLAGDRSDRESDRGWRRQQGVPDLRPPNRRQPPVAPPVELTIERLGTDGAGLARLDGAWVAVPLALPGERVRAIPGRKGAPGRLLGQLTSNSLRIPPSCRHFGTCGGCSLQHLAPAPYAEFKRRLVADALSRHGITGIDIRPTSVSPPHSRRRASMAARRSGQAVRLGFRAMGTHDIVDLAECPVLVPSLAALLPRLRAVLLLILSPGETAGIVLDDTESGIDLGLVLTNEPSLAALEALAELAGAGDLARIWSRREAGVPTPIAERRRPVVRFGGIAVELPPGGFRQATAAGEATLIQAVETGVGTAGTVADLFAGIGTFALSLAARRTIHAVESDPAAVAVLAGAGRRGKLKTLTTERRDLESRPLLAAELARFGAVILDPPRAGARAQIAELARSAVPSVVMVSCDPATFARDTATLIAGGYALADVQPVDQFLWSSHIELIARFQRP